MSNACPIRKSFVRPVLVLAAACSAVLLGAGAAPAEVWDTYNNANRLNSANAVGGKVWCASDYGLHRYDPATGVFTRYAKAPGALASNSVAEVEVAADGSTWFATRDAGVSVVSKLGRWRTLSAFDGVLSDSVTCLEPSSVGMWVGTNRGLSVFDGLTLIAAWPDGVNPSPFVSNGIYDIAHVGDSTWVATGEGVYVTRTTEGVTWTRVVNGLAGFPARSLANLRGEAWCVSGGRIYRGGQTGVWTLAQESLPATTAYTIHSRGDSLLAGTSSGVFVRTSATAWQALGSGFPGNAWVDFGDDGSIWAGNAEGLWRWDGTFWRFATSPGPQGNWVQGMALDRSNLWIATRDQGVARFDGTSWRSFTPAAGATPDTTLLSPDFVFTMFVDREGYKWAGDWGSSLARIEDSTDPARFTHYFSPLTPPFDSKKTFLWASAQDPQGNRWFGCDTPLQSVITPLGIIKVDPLFQSTVFNPSTGAAMSGFQVRAIAFGPGPGFEMWVGYASGGVDIFTDPTLATLNGRLTTATSGLLSDDIWGIAMNGDSVWIATAGGLMRYSRSTRQRIETLATQSPSTQGAVNPLALDVDGSVWWATQAGLYHRKTDRTVDVYHADDTPLLSDDVHSVVVDRATGDVWIGSVRGVNRIRRNPGTNGGTVTVPSTFRVQPNPAFLSSAGLILRTGDFEGPVELAVYDLRGRLVRASHPVNASGATLWDGTDEHGVRVSPGVYILRVDQSGSMRTGRVVLVR
jgi:ligand-binding sensor domain-containing protein